MSDTWNEDELFRDLVGILRTHLNVTAPLIPDSALLSDGVLDSLEFMNYLTRIEERFGISLSDGDIAAKQLGIMRNMARHLKDILLNK